MMYNNENALTEARTFAIPLVEDTTGDFNSDDLNEDFDGLQLSFQRVKIPSGGGVQFEIPGDNPDDPDTTKTIEGVIVFNHAACAYWADGDDYSDNMPPSCSSVDGKTGIGNPGGACEVCEFNRYGTGTDAKGNPTKGKACKNMRNLYILRNGEYMPILLSLPPTSLRAFNDFVSVVFATRRKPTYSSVIQIGLKKVDSGPKPYSVATFRKLFDFEGEQLMQAKRYATSFREQIRTSLHQQAISNIQRTEPDELLDADSRYVTTGNGDQFEVIDGERDILP